MGEIKKRLPLQCPACNAPLRVGRLFCGECRTEVCGDFELPVLARLSDMGHRTKRILRVGRKRRQTY